MKWEPESIGTIIAICPPALIDTLFMPGVQQGTKQICDKRRLRPTQQNKPPTSCTSLLAT